MVSENKINSKNAEQVDVYFRVAAFATLSKS